MTYLLDTCVISELAAKRPAPEVERWIKGIDPESDDFMNAGVRLLNPWKQSGPEI